MARRRAYTFFYDEDSIELDRVTEGDYFAAENELNRADILKDILEDITDRYNQAVEDHLNMMKRFVVLKDFQDIVDQSFDDAKGGE